MKPRVRLSTLLVAVNAGLVLLAVGGMAVAARGLLVRLAAEQALARVELAAANAAQAIERSVDDVRTSAVLLGERPTVGRLLAARTAGASGDDAGLAAFLERYRSTLHLAGCAIVSDERVHPASGSLRLPPAALDLARRADPAAEVLLVHEAGSPPLLAAVAPVATFPAARAVVLLALDADLVRRVAQPAGLTVSLIEGAPLSGGDPLGASAVAGSDAYTAIRPLGAPLAGLAVRVALPTESVSSSLARVGHRLLLLSLAVAAIATLGGWALGRRISRPVAALDTAVARIGRGDLETPVPPAPGAELGALAATLETMRGRLLRQTAELARRQAEGEAILSGISEGVFSVDRDRRIRYLNPQAAALLGTTAEKALGQFCGDVLRPLAAHGVRPCESSCPIVHARARGGAQATETLAALAGSQGVHRAVVITSSPPADGLQFQVLRDETDLEAARRMRDAVLAHVSHEFKTPLAAQLASIELLEERLEHHPDDDARDLVAALQRGALRLTQLVDNLLESARLEAGQTSIRRRPVALDGVIEEAVELASPLFVQRGQRLTIDLPYPLPSVQGDAPRLIQVFVNLLANANKFAPRESEIRIGGEVSDRAVTLWIEDEGPGLPEVPGGTLFGRYVRAPAESDEPEAGGAGLGLWIAQSIVERHGGSIEALRRGAARDSVTRVAVRLPREGG